MSTSLVYIANACKNWTGDTVSILSEDYIGDAIPTPEILPINISFQLGQPDVYTINIGPFSYI